MQFTYKKRTRTFRFCCKKICYEERWRNICADLNVTAMLTGMQGGYTKFCSFSVNGAGEREAVTTE